MSKSERRRIADSAMAALDGEIAVRRAELAALERARDTLARSNHCDLDSPLCAGVVHSAVCRACGFVARRCLAHGAARSVADVLRRHDHDEHGPGWATSAATDNARGVLPDRAAVSVGGVSPPLTPHGERGPDPTESAEPIETAEHRPPSERG